VGTLTVLSKLENRGFESVAIGSSGDRFDVPVTQHTGWINDFSCNAGGRANTNFGVMRNGLDFAC
jgi:hypothetical protein